MRWLRRGFMEGPPVDASVRVGVCQTCGASFRLTHRGVGPKTCPERSCDFANKLVCSEGSRTLARSSHVEADSMSTVTAGRRSACAGVLLAAVLTLVFLALPAEAQQAAAKEPA